MVRARRFHCWGPGSIPCWGTMSKPWGAAKKQKSRFKGSTICAKEKEGIKNPIHICLYLHKETLEGYVRN